LPKAFRGDENRPLRTRARTPLRPPEHAGSVQTHPPTRVGEPPGSRGARASKGVSMVPPTDGMITAPDLARLTGTRVKPVCAWPARGLRLATGARWPLPVRGRGRRGHRLYSLEDAQTAMDAVRVRGTSNADRIAA